MRGSLAFDGGGSNYDRIVKAQLAGGDGRRFVVEHAKDDAAGLAAAVFAANGSCIPSTNPRSLGSGTEGGTGTDAGVDAAVEDAGDDAGEAAPRHVHCSVRAMLKLRLASVIALFGVISVFVTGCPEGAGIGQPGQDGGEDADAEARHDGEASEGGDGDGAVAEGGGPTTSSGALCGPNGRDDCGAFLLCSEALGCVECKQDSDCPAAAARCLAGTCAGCRPGMSLTLHGSRAPQGRPTRLRLPVLASYLGRTILAIEDLLRLLRWKEDHVPGPF